MRRSRPFDLHFSAESAQDIATLATRTLPPPPHGVALVVTPNIDHIARLRRSPEFRKAYTGASHTFCDGWPVAAYARFCGHPLRRVTGCDITAEIMRTAPYPADQRLYFVVDSPETEAAVQAWASRHQAVCATAVPPLGFEQDASYCLTLAQAIRRHETTILFMAVGAPRSEIFVDRCRALLPQCWAFCVGQAVKVELGLSRRASKGWQATGLEWAWRISQEPKRLARRYVGAAVGFSLAVLEDQFRSPHAAINSVRITQQSTRGH